MMVLSYLRVSAMDDIDLDIRRSIDDAMDDGELLPFRYQNRLDKS